MKCTSLSRILCSFLTLTVFCGFVSADSGARAPQFTARTLDGQTFNNASLRGSVILLEFWATWCPNCRSDESALDNIERNFSDKGLIVLTIDVGEPETTVRNYLQQHPRLCPVVLDEGKDLSARFGDHGYPYYVLINREGYIVGTQNGAGGEESLLYLLRRAGLSLHSDTPHGANQSSASSSDSSGPKVIEVPRSQRSLPPKPSPKTIFVLASGERLESDHYTIDAGILHVALGGQQRAIALSALDLKATAAVNRERGVDLKIPQSRNEVFVAF